MRWLIRRVLKKGKGAVSYEEDVHYGDVLTIGRAADQAIFLPDLRAALNHARITLLASGQYKIESLILAGIRVNNEITYVTTAGAGAIVEIGNTRMTLLAAAQDFDGGVEVSTLDKSEQSAEKQKHAKPTRLNQTGLSKRRPSWFVFATMPASPATRTRPRTPIRSSSISRNWATPSAVPAIRITRDCADSSAPISIFVPIAMPT